MPNLEAEKAMWEQTADTGNCAAGCFKQVCKRRTNRHVKLIGPPEDEIGNKVHEFRELERKEATAS